MREREKAEMFAEDSVEKQLRDRKETGSRGERERTGEVFKHKKFEEEIKTENRRRRISKSR